MTDEQLRHEIDIICDKFEAACKAGERPSIRQYLDSLPAEAQRPLFAELLLVELHYRTSVGEDCSVDDYLPRFRQFEQEVRRGFDELTAKSEQVPDNSGPAGPTFVPSQDAGEANQSLEDTGLAPTFSMETSESSAVGKSDTPVRVGSVLGDYHLTDLLGRGGMGVVYRATQQLAGRTVALKVIRNDCLEGLDASSREHTIQRFQAEARAAAQLEHDHLVPVYEVGEARGRHFYSMRFVNGVSLYDLLTEGPLAEVEVARYLEPVARAVNVAHLQNILHRDLKPHNILIERRTDRALVADFGLAKLTEGGHAATETGVMMGSPPYMSPEQTRDASAVNVTTDVYGLGATLYHMLCGRPPFQGSSVAATIRQVNEQDPVAPRLLNAAISRDMETICLKCLEKDPYRRYQSAEELADDLLRLRKQEPIKARRIGVLGRSVRWCRRKPLLSGLICSVALLLIVMFAGGAVFLNRLSRANRNLEASLEREQQAAAAAKREARNARTQTTRAQEARELADKNFLLAHAAVEKTVTTIAAHPELNNVPQRTLRKQLVEPMLPFLEEFVAQSPNNPEYLEQYANACYQLGRIFGFMDENQKSFDFAERACEAFETLRTRDPERFELEFKLASARVLLADRYAIANQYDEAVAAYSNAIDLFDELVKRREGGQRSVRHDLAMARGNLGRLHAEGGRPQKAIEPLQLSIELQRRMFEANREEPVNIRNLVAGLEALGNAYTMLRRFDDAKLAYDESAKYLKILSELPDSSVDVDNNLANRLYNIALLSFRQAKYGEAQTRLNDCLSTLRHLQRVQPREPNHPFRMSQVFRLRAATSRELDNNDNAVADARQSVTIVQGLFNATRQPVFGRALAGNYDLLATTLREAGKHEEAVAGYEKSRQLYKPLATNPPTSPAVVGEYAQTLLNVATLYRELRRVEEAEEAFKLARQQYAGLRKAESGNPSFRSGYFSSTDHLAALALERGAHGVAEKYLDELEPLLESLHKSELWRPIYIARYSLKRATLAEAERKSDRGLGEVDEAVQVLEEADKSGSLSANLWSLLVRSHLRRAELLRQLERQQAASDAWVETVSNARRALRSNDTGDVRLEVATVLARASLDAADDPTLTDEQGAAKSEGLAKEVASQLDETLSTGGDRLQHELETAFSDPAIQKLLHRDDFKSIRDRWEKVRKHK